MSDIALFVATAGASLLLLRNQKVREDTTPASLCKELAPSVQFGSKRLIGLLFAASWCDDCWDTVPAIEKVATGCSKDIQVYYISSDRTENEMTSYCNPAAFTAIPYANESERSAIKRHFQTCAKSEMEQVGIEDRKNGTPNLVVMDGKTGRVLTQTGVADCIKYATAPEKAVRRWKRLL